MTETEQAQTLLNYLSSNVLRRPGIQLKSGSRFRLHSGCGFFFVRSLR